MNLKCCISERYLWKCGKLEIYLYMDILVEVLFLEAGSLFSISVEC